MMFVAFFIMMAGCRQIQQQEEISTRSLGLDWSYEASAFGELRKNSTLVNESTYVATKIKNIELYYHFYEDVFLGEHYILSNHPHKKSDGTTLIRLHHNEKTKLRKV